MAIFTKKRFLHQVFTRTWLPILLAVVTMGGSYGKSTNHQELLNQRINISVSNVTFKSLLMHIEKQAGLTFSYQKHVVALEEKITFEAKNEYLDEVLKKVLTSRNIHYQVIKANQVVLTKILEEQKSTPRIGLNEKK